MQEFWERKFQEIDTEWGFEAADTALQCCNFFIKNKIKKILIPGIGYGRNARVFIDKGITVSGIEISATAIKLAREKNKLDIKIHHGSINDMPFDTHSYEGIYCYALLHLLNSNERGLFIKNCFNQLQNKGYMIFVTLSKKSDLYGKGKLISKDRFELMPGLNVYFYDRYTAAAAFKDYGLIDIQEIDEPIKHMDQQPPLKLLMISCQKI
jgi:2-polyprenyl-3-methyl-5-hydroxy-6-metoxy-1,4-benzoquinol methylase